MQKWLDQMTEKDFRIEYDGKDKFDKIISISNFFCPDQHSQQQLEMALDILDRSQSKIRCLRGL